MPIYKAGIYARLSSDYDIKKNESASIQIEIAKKYVEEINQKNMEERIDIIECYTDLGKTGSNFYREGFQRLMKDIRLGKINCVIVKDLSRFGRNYLETGDYIEKIFPFMGVRFIAVADNYDTGKDGNENNQIVSEIKNLVNDMYVKDSSKKAKLQLMKRREEGSYVGGPPPFGYDVIWDKKKRALIPDENTAFIVKFIYEKFIETESYKAVVNLLNKKKINPPAVYKRTKEVYHTSKEEEYKGWDKSTVERIVKNNIYLGILVQGKTAITSRDEKNRIYKSEDKWVVTKDAHEPLIDTETFQNAVKIREKIKTKSAPYNHSSLGCPLEDNIFESVLYCGVCGRKMTRSSYVKKNKDGVTRRVDSYFCLNGGQTKVSACPDSNRISKAELVYILLKLIRIEFAIFLDDFTDYIEFGKKLIKESVKKMEILLRKTKSKLRRFSEEEGSIYINYRYGNISQEDYLDYKSKHNNKLLELRKIEKEQIQGLKEVQKLSKQYMSAISSLLTLKSDRELTKEMIEDFIYKIYVYPDKRIEIIFAFTDLR